jgi:hypothetical protein
MNGIFKKTALLVLMVFFPVLLCGCSEEAKLYNEAKKMMLLSGRAVEMEKFPTAASKVTEDERQRHEDERQRYYIYKYTYQEWAGDIFTGLGEFKDSKELAKEAYYLAAAYNYEIYRLERRYLFLDWAHTLFAKAGDYKDSSELVVECSITKVKTALTYTSWKHDVAELFQSFDDKSKEKVAELLYQQAASSLAADDWGMSKETEKRQAYFKDLFLLGIIKKTLPADIREKMYRAAVDEYHAGIREIMDRAAAYGYYDGYGSRSNISLPEAIFDYLGDYRDSPLWLRWVRELTKTPIINGSALAEQAGGAGGTPQARTVAVIFSTDGKVNDAFVERRIESNIKEGLCMKLKVETKGNIFFTQDPAQASAIIHYAISHELFGSFNYSGGGVASYYHTKAITEIRSADGTVLLRKSRVVRFDKPQDSIGGDFRHMNITMGVPIYDAAETLKILEKQFTAMENK